MENRINLLKQSNVEQIEKYKNLVINKKSASYPVYKVPLKYLYYNDKNDRISTELIRYTSENKKEIPDNREEYNQVFENLIYKSNNDKLNKTKKSIEGRGQDNPGVTLIDGRVVDGNRRFTCLRLIEKETNIEQYFETVILDKDYVDDYKYVKSLELELQMGVEGPVEYDPIDRLFGLYNSIRIEKKFTPEEYANLFDEITVNDVKNDLKLAELMCRYLEFIDSPGKFYLAKDMKLDGVLHEIPAVLEKVRKKYPDLVDETESFIFTLITMDVDSKLNIYVRDLKSIVDNANYPKLLEMVRPSVIQTMDVIDKTEIDKKEDIADIRKNTEISEKLKQAVIEQKKVAISKVMNDAPVKHLRDVVSTLKSISVETILEMDQDRVVEARQLVKNINELMGTISESLDS